VEPDMLSERLKRLTHNSTLRLVFSYFVVFIVSSLILLTFIYWSSVDYIYKQLDQHIEYDLHSLQTIYQQDGQEKLTKAINDRLDHKNYDSVYLLYSRLNSKILAGNLSNIPDALTTGWHIVPLDKLSKALHHKTHSARVLKTTLSTDLILLNGLDIESAHQQEHIIINSLMAGIAIIIILGGIGGFIVSINTMNKINFINDTMVRVGNGELEQRVPTHGTDDDFDLLAENFNQMLDRLQVLMERIQNISNNVAHDLRTPLTRIRNQLESIQEQCDDAVLDKVELTIDETDSLLATFETILNINKFESGVQKLNIARISSQKLIQDVLDYNEPLALDKGIRIQSTLDQENCFMGDQNMLFLTLTNIINNAIKYAPVGGLIEATVRECEVSLSGYEFKQPQLAIVISDNGVGIPDSEKNKVFELFYRSEKHRDHQGNGLGLSLVAAVIHLHHGKIELHNNKPGLKVCLYIPIDKK